MLTVCMEKRGDFYMAWHQDARDIRSALADTPIGTVAPGFVVLRKSGGVDTIGILAHDLEDAVSKLNVKGISVKINSRIPA